MLLKVISVLLAHLLCLTAVQSQWRVTHSSKRVCGLKGASVVLPCRYDYPRGSEGDTYWGGGWYKKRREFRRHRNSKYPNCSLKIENISDEHSGVYHFKFYTARHYSWIEDTSGVDLSIADLQVREDVVKGNQNQTKVTCSSSCSLGSHRGYVWYKNGQKLPDRTTASILLNPTSLSEVGSYFCAVRGYEANRAPAACAPEKLCWAVKCVSTSVCTLAGTSQDISCTYRYPSDHSIHTTSWEKTREPQVDLQLAEEFHDLSPYKGKTGKVTLKVSHLKEGDAGRYVLKMETKQGKVYSGSPGITLFVTFLQVKMTPDTVIEGERVTLTCYTTCSLSNNPTFIWYKNGQPLTSNHTTRDNKLQLNPVSSEDSGNYSCAVRGHESLSSTAVFLNVRYKPKNVSVSISASGDMGEGDTVTLTCSSEANPPVHNYTWYMKTGAESLVRGTGESISFNVTSDTSGLYYCQAQNEVGSQTSTEVAVQGGDVAVTLPAIITTFLILAVLLILGIVYFGKQIRRMISGARATNVNIQSDSGLLYATVATRRMTSDPTHRVATRDQDDVQYANVQIKRPNTQTTLQEDSVTYASVQFHRGSAATRAENDDVIYSGFNQL